MNKGLKLYTSNRMELLGERIAEVLKAPLSSPLEKEIIVVQSKGMERWLKMRIATHHGVCANVQFPYPNAFVDDISRKVLRDFTEKSPFDPAVMTWRILDLLPDCVRQSGFEAIRSYVGGVRSELKKYQLAATISDLFDQYLTFRPDMILSWEKGAEKDWQAMLWRRLIEKTGGLHRAALHRRLITDLGGKNRRGFLELPERISVFGISTLPPFHLQILSALAHVTEVNLFLMNPCREYWGEIFSQRGKEAFLKRAGQGGDESGPLHLEEGNSLLASMGTLGREFFSMVTELECEEQRYFMEPEPVNLLQTLQTDILNLRDRPAEGLEKSAVVAHDQSIRIHSCHTPMREMEVLYDQLLSMFEDDPALQPRDILVMTPDIEAYAPFVQAVFGVPESEETRIPFSIADRSPVAESPLFESFLAVLELTKGRFTTEDVLNVLECEAIREKFRFTEQDLSMIRHWTGESGIRWGRDGAQRQGMGLPPYSENTWRFGLDRLLLGYAMPGSNHGRIFKDILPFDQVEGEDAAVLGRFVAFLENLMSHVADLGKPRTIQTWAKTLQKILEDLFSEEGTGQRNAQMIRQSLADLREQAEISGFSGTLPLDAVKSAFLKQLGNKTYGSGFLTEGVTFCSMLPMRSIPFKVICVVGMNGDAYPRQTRKLGFDLMIRKPRRGDRSRRNDDRYLFLETILSARDILYISYVGQSVEDNSTVPPSSLVSELLDYLEENFEFPGSSAENVQERLVVSHRLQAFSPAYFNGNRKYFSYSGENLEASMQKLSTSRAPCAFISTGISPPGDEWKTVSLDAFMAFFSSPARFLLKERLGITLGVQDTGLHETEPFKVDGLEKYLLEQHLLGEILSGKDPAHLFRGLKLEGRMPHGMAGKCTFERLSQGVEAFAKEVRKQSGDVPAHSLELEVDLNGLLVKGRIDGIRPTGLLQYRYTTAKAKDHLALWIKHLLINQAGDPGIPRQSTLLASDGCWIYSPVDSSRELLEHLGKIYLRGLEKPLPFFPDTSLAYAKACLSEERHDADALERARARWIGNPYQPHSGESEDDFYQLCFRQTDPFDDKFRALALEIFGPLLAATKKIS
ncbi:MAG: exodeoxyribonuclease V subunit gamma [Desulfatiglandaceae bacterium]